MRHRDALKSGFYDLISAKEEYKLRCDKEGMRKDIVIKYIYSQILMLFPICPHITEYIYIAYLKKYLPSSSPELLSFASWPDVIFLNF